MLSRKYTYAMCHVSDWLSIGYRREYNNNNEAKRRKKNVGNEKKSETVLDVQLLICEKDRKCRLISPSFNRVVHRTRYVLCSRRTTWTWTHARKLLHQKDKTEHEVKREPNTCRLFSMKLRLTIDIFFSPYEKKSCVDLTIRLERVRCNVFNTDFWYSFYFPSRSQFSNSVFPLKKWRFSWFWFLPQTGWLWQRRCFLFFSDDLRLNSWKLPISIPVARIFPPKFKFD